MKKTLAILLATLLCAAMLTGALAEAPVYELTGAEWVDGSNYLCVRGSNGYYLATMDGTAITADEFAGIEYSDGLFIAAKRSIEDINDSGAVNAQGEEIIPFQYADIDVLNENWAVGKVLAEATADNYDYTVIFGNMDYAIIERVDIYNVATATCVASLAREAFRDADAFGAYINVESRSDGVITTYDADFNALGTVDYVWKTDLIPETGLHTFRENGQDGLMDADGNVVLAPSFYSIYDFEDDGYARVYTGDTYGLIDESGNVIVPAEYDRIYRGYHAPGGSGYNNAGFFGVEKNGKMGYVTAGGALSCELKYASDAVENNGASATYTDIAGDVHIIAGDGAECTVEGYAYMYPANYGSGVFYRVRNDDYDYGLIDFHGNVVIPCENDDVSLSGDGQYVLVETNDGRCLIYELSYPTVEAASAEEAAPTAEEAPAASESASGTAALLDSAIVLLNADPAANADAVVGLLNTALNQLGAESAAGAIISSAINTLQSDSAANSATVVALLENAKTLL